MSWQLQLSCSWSSLSNHLTKPLATLSPSRPFKHRRQYLNSPHVPFGYFPYEGGKGVAAQTRSNNMDNLEGSDCSCSKFDPFAASNEGTNCKIQLRWMACYFICRATVDQIRPLMEKMISSLILSSNCMTNLPLACISDAIKRPVPLNLDVTFPSLENIKWSFSRLYYLFNVQLERNIGINKQHPLEECLWDAWACLCSSSTHLRQKTQVERVLGFILAIWGLLFYSRLLSTTTEQFREAKDSSFV